MLSDIASDLIHVKVSEAVVSNTTDTSTIIILAYFEANFKHISSLNISVFCSQKLGCFVKNIHTIIKPLTYKNHYQKFPVLNPSV